MISQINIVFIAICYHIKLCEFKPQLGYFNTSIKDRWLSVNYIPILDSEIHTSVVVKESIPVSSAACALNCFLGDSHSSIFYKNGIQMCYCNDRKLPGVTATSAASGSVYADYMVHYQKFSNGFEIKLSVHSFKRDCSELYDDGNLSNGVYRISPDGGKAFEVYCDMDGGGWTVFQRREDGSVDFYLDWNSYKEGFGHLMGEHWLGLDSLHRLVQEPSELYIELSAFDDIDGQREGYAYYSTFHIEDETNFYRLNVSGFTGDVGDSLEYSNGNKFSTKDKDNDPYTGDNCAVKFKGAWWYKQCHASNLNGLYLSGPTTTFADGVVWKTGWTHYYSLKRTAMKTRRK